MKSFRSLIGLILSLAPVIFSLGLSADHAAARTMGAASAGLSVSGVMGVIGAGLGRDAGVSGIAPLSPSVPSLLSALPIGTPLVLRADVVPSAGTKAVVPGARATAIEALKTALSASSASLLFDGLKPVKSNASFLAAAKKDADKDMPDSGEFVDGTGRPVDRDGGIDDLGNLRRSGGEGGPDDRSDPDQSDRGGGELF